ncbi:class II aldolase/adducin family protein [Pararhodobacter sp.]|uniref:class II aldolase/adducin family protein n=1 Tax=Pararhodobacter sp. TaxID=2127056 RepID=UPI002FDE66A6
MKSLWNEAEVDGLLAATGACGAERDLALRVYSSRLIGQEPELVLHGGGNTSVKTQRADAGGRLRDVLHVKGSGWDLGTIEEPGLPAVWLAPLLQVAGETAMRDEEMVALLRREMLDPTGPTPSVEALLHAFLPGKFVDHTHSCAALAIANQPDAAERALDIFGSELCVIPYVMPGFQLSVAANRLFAARGAEAAGLFLVNHGLFSQGPDARSAYEAIIRYTTQCEEHLAQHGAALVPPAAQQQDPAREGHATLDALRTALSEWPVFSGGLALDLRYSAAIDQYLALPDLAGVCTRGTVTPDHVIRIKPRPVLGDEKFGLEDWQRAVRGFADWYEAYFHRNAARATEGKTMLDPLPRVALIRGLGLVGIGKTAKEAGIAADLAEQGARVVLSAEALGRFTPLSEGDLFDMEYWSLEQAKLKPAG